MLGINTWKGKVFVLVVVICTTTVIPARSSADSPTVVINEVMWAKAEYIELYNTTNSDILLNGWKFTRQKTATDTEDIEVTFTASDTIPANGFFLIETSEGATTVPSNKIKSILGLVDAGALLRLRDNSDVVIDTANQYGAWFGGENSAIGASMERNNSIGVGGQSASWHTSVGDIGGRTGTPGAANSILVTPSIPPSPTPTNTIIPSISPTPSSIPAYSSAVYINEFIPNPTGDDSKLEFIELVNTSSNVVDLSGWVLDDIADSGSSPFIIPDGTEISANGYIVFYSDQIKLSLNNDSDHVRLLRPDGSIQDDRGYESSKEGYSYNRVDGGNFEQSAHSTPGEENIIELPTSTPSPTPKVSATLKPTSAPTTYDFSSKLVLNEVYPSPVKGDKNNEFIEIKNLENRTILLVGWSLDDEDGGSRPYRFKRDAVIGSKKILLLDKNTTKIALNNSGDSARLINPLGQVVAIISYEKTYPRKSYSRLDDGSYAWTDIVTPGNENIIRVQEDSSPSPKKLIRKKLIPKSRVAGIVSNSVVSPIISLLPSWPNADSSKVSETVVGKSSIPSTSTQKQRLFIFFGGICASLQLLSGISRKEKIWFG